MSTSSLWLERSRLDGMTYVPQ
ncbi:hypothetical protein AZE42_09978 [Rhizopogon vesiculosus]|uniref:Uncharacterized protein n=1 Tax=Rhizopogon vesiculosus TaxID=180088 RepID=A0A1J8QYY7_9AGAM|nr:hypothetical protein AZE42_09978 [Rhizopogon vesiculosus]